ncbi:MAG: ADOP family duplicated permease [Thermoanaerobaculia bacterium]
MRLAPAETLGRDLRDAVRALVRRPLLTLVAVGSLALGIGATTTLSSLVDAVLVAPLPAAEPQRLLYAVLTRIDKGGHYAVPYHNYMAWREADAFTAMTAYRSRTVTTRGDDGGERLTAKAVRPDFFATLGVEPVLGRGFDAGDAGRGERLVILGHGLWQRRFGGSENVLSRSLDLDGEPHTIVGVMAAGSTTGFLGYGDLWTLLEVDEAAALETPMRGFSVLGRLRDGVTPAAAQRQLRMIAARLAEEVPELNQGWTVAARPVRDWILEDVEGPLWVVFAVSVLVLLTACGTVANLMLSEVASRRRAAAVRKALGAPAWWLVRAFLVESLLLAVAGGVLGLALAAVGVDLAASLLAERLPRVEAVGLDLRTLAAMLAATFAAVLVSGLAPAWMLARTPAEALRGRGTGDRGGHWLRRSLLAAETGLAIVAVIGAALCVQSLRNLRAVDPGFAPGGLLTLRIELPEAEPEVLRAQTENLLTRLEALPGVAVAGASGLGLPLVDNTGTFELFVEGRDRGVRPNVVTGARYVSPGYREAMGIDLAAGRWFAAGETWESGNAVVVNETMAGLYWPGREAVGRWVEWASGDRGTVVGVVGDVHASTLARDVHPEVYVAWGKTPPIQALAVRSAGPGPRKLMGTVRSAIAAAVPGAAIFDVATGEEIVRRSYGDRRVWALLLSLFAVLAVTLGSVGLYAVVARWVASREREIGVRMALGARPSGVVRLVLAQGLVPVTAGAALGIMAAVFGVRYLESQLYGLTPEDPWTFAAGVLAVVTVAVLVCVLPARRAARVDPAVALRGDS